MSGINFSTKNEGTWFFFDESQPELGKVCLRELSFEEARRIDQLTTKTKKVFRGGQWTEFKKTDEEAAQKLTFVYCIVDWNNVLVDGVELECNANNKYKAMRSLDFAKFILDCISELKDKNVALDEARSKNLEGTSNGDPQSQTVKTVSNYMKTAIERLPVENAE